MSQIALPPRIEKLTAEHDIADFRCGVDVLDRFLASYALINQKAGSSQTYVAVVGEAIVGYYSLTVGNTVYDDAPKRLAQGLPRHPIPIILLARLAIHKDWQGQRLGAGMLLDALRRTVQAADIAGVRAFLVHAKDESAKTFYTHFGFEPFTHEPLTLYRLLKDVRLMLES